MKLKSKYKWTCVGLIFMLSWVGLVKFSTLGLELGILTLIMSIIMLIASTGYGLSGMIDAKVFERFYEWLKTDDV